MSGQCFISNSNSGERFYLGENSDVPFERARMLAAYAAGLNPIPYKYLAIGSGNTIDFVNPDIPPLSKDIVNKYFAVENPDVRPRLFSEFYRVQFFRSTFVDIDGNYTNIPNRVIEIIWQIPEQHAIGTWKELGIFTGDATSESNSGSMVHYFTISDWNRIPASFKDSVINFHWRVGF